MIDLIILHQLDTLYTPEELVELLELDVYQIAEAFEEEVMEKLGILIDKERGIGL